MTLIACTWSLQAQTRTYHGTVLDAANNEPLIGATVLPIGGGQGAAADIDGKFTITVPSNVKSVKVTYVGYKEKTVPLTENMKVYLESTSSNLDDVVVVAYGTANKESLTGSVAVVGSKEIEDRPVTSVTAALEGNAPGVQVNNSVGQPGASPSIRIRGFNSFTSSAMSPLYVVDGIVYDGDISDINPADIESMSVLKDAASSALYGNRGANGVILITTKRAKSVGKVEVSLQVRQGIYERGLPYYDTLDANQWMETALSGWARGGYSSGTYNSYAEAVAGMAPNFVNSFLLGTNIYDKEPQELFDSNGKLQGNIRPGYTDLDWWDVVSQTGYRQEYNINATGATDKFNVFASVGYLKENGYMIKTDFERFNGRLVANFEPVSFFRTGVNLSATYTDSDQGVLDPSDADSMNSSANPFLVNTFAPVLPYYQHDADGNIIYDADGSPLWYTAGLAKDNNVAWNMRLDDSNYNGLYVTAMAYGTAVLPYGFELTVRGSMSRNKRNAKSYSNNLIGAQKGKGGLDVTNSDYRSHTFMQTLTWDHQYGDHHVDVLLDHENYNLYQTYNMLRKSGQQFPGMITISNFEDNDFSTESIAAIRTESYLGRVRYNYDQKYFGEVSIRRDGTSRFADDHRWGTFWSVGGSWILTKEKFMQGLTWLNYLKLRAAYGSVGNDAAADAYAYRDLYMIFPYGGVGSLRPYTRGNTNLKWEATKTFDVALEGSLFNDRFNFTVGYFNKRNSDLLFNRSQPMSGGTMLNWGSQPTIMQNIGTMDNYGWEIALGVDIIRNQSFTWSFNVDATFMKNKIVKLPDGQDIPGQALFQGKSIYEKYTYAWAGVDKMTGNSLYEMVPNSPDYYTYENGKLVYQDKVYKQNFNGALNTGHLFKIGDKYYTDRPQYAGRKLLGSALPTVYGSFSTALTWKGINLSMLFTYSLGGKVSNGVYQSLMGVGSNGAGALHKDVLKAWTHAPEGMTRPTPEKGQPWIINASDIDPNGVPVLDTNLNNYNNMFSSQYLVSSDYLTLKNINLTYDLPKKWVNAIKLSNINLGVSIDNLFIITRQKGLNPQYNFSGGQGNSYVPARVYSFQLGVKF